MYPVQATQYSPGYNNTATRTLSRAEKQKVLADKEPEDDMIRTRKMRVEGEKVTKTKKGERGRGCRGATGKEGGGGDKIQEGG